MSQALTRPVRSGSRTARGAASPPRRRRRVSPGRVITCVLATIWLVIVIAPIYYMVLASFRSQGGYLTENPWLPSSGLTVSEYGTVFGAGLGRYLVNSVIITTVCIALTLSLCLGAASRIVRHSTRAAGASFRILLIGLAIPIQAIIVPLYLLVYTAHLYDTLFALMLTMSAAAVPVSVLATLSIYDGLNVWNNFILPLVLTQSNSVAVLPLGLTKLEGQYAINVPAVMAAVLLSVLPLVVLFVVMRKQVMRSPESVVMR